MATQKYLLQWAMVLLCVTLHVKEVHGAAADLSSCPTALQNLLPCLNYVQGLSQVPATSCCKNLLTIHTNTPQCLCELIAASVNGTAGLPKMNTTLSLQLGPACGVKTDPSRCPGLLGISADSPAAKIFETGVTPSSGAPAEGPTGGGPSGAAVPPQSGSHSFVSGIVGILGASVVMAFAALAIML